MDLFENIIFGFTIGLFITNFILPGSFANFIFLVILLILVLLFDKRSDKNGNK